MKAEELNDQTDTETEYPSIIYKAPLEVVDGEQIILLPNTAKIVAVQEQNGKIYVWFQWYQHPDNADKLHQWRFRIIGTGERFQASKVSYLATVQMPPFIWHVYKVQT